jgi:hypothetical protein
VEQATWLVPGRGITVARQRRIATGLRWLYTGREYVPDPRRIRLVADGRSTDAARVKREALDAAQMRD